MKNENLIRKKPYIWQIELTNHCFFQCIGCPYQYMQRKKGFMDFHTFKECIYAIKDIQKEIRPVGLHHFGEPTLHKDLVKYVQFASENEVPTSFSCNPQFLSKETMKGLLNANLNRIVLSLDALDEDTLKKIKGKNANYELTIKNIRLFLKLKKESQNNCEIRIQMVAYKLNQKDWKQFLKMWENEDCYAYIKGYDYWSIPKLNEFSAKSLNVFCDFPFNSIVVLWDGRIVPCCHDFDGKLVMGSIFDGIENVWKNEKYTAFREKFVNNKFFPDFLCSKCSFNPYRQKKGIS
ncbi:radical SAM/SPASM domain-containing protein [Candidatus Harpocratesius sp.]